MDRKQPGMLKNQNHRKGGALSTESAYANLKKIDE
jgi:hypothetical protein